MRDLLLFLSGRMYTWIFAIRMVEHSLHAQAEKALGQNGLLFSPFLRLAFLSSDFSLHNCEPLPRVRFSRVQSHLH